MNIDDQINELLEKRKILEKKRDANKKLIGYLEKKTDKFHVCPMCEKIIIRIKDLKEKQKRIDKRLEELNNKIFELNEIKHRML